MPGTFDGAEVTAAKRLGISVEVYRENRALGLKHCGGCRRWLKLDAFGIDRSRGDGLARVCRDCKNGRERQLYEERGGRDR